MTTENTTSSGEFLAEIVTVASFIFLTGMSIMSICMFVLYMFLSPIGWGIVVPGGH